MSLSFLSLAYQHVNRGGTARLFGVSREARYNRIGGSFLQDVDLDAAISSLDVYASSSAFSNVILFSNLFQLGPFSIPLPNFQGDYRQVVNPKSTSVVFANLTDHNFNDRTRSLLLVNTSRQAEFRVSFRDTFLEEWKSVLDDELGSEASRRGDPLMTWEPFPEGISHLDPNLIYLKIHQNLTIILDWWPDYDASITYHLFLYLDGNRRLQGYVQRWAAWVEGGIKSGEIFDRLWPKVEAGVNTINARLSDRLTSVPALNDFYYLPGRQTAPSSSISTGHTFDDVTIVAEL